MNEVRKLPASAGAEWVLGGFALLRASPLGLGLLGVIYGLFSLLVATSARMNMGLFMVLELAMVVAGPLLMGGFVYATRNVDRGGRAEPGHLLQGLRDGHATPLLGTLLPNVVAVLLCMLLLYVLVGAQAVTELAAAIERASTQGAADPGMFTGFPVGRFMLWLLLSLLVGIVAGFFVFVAIPEIMFTGRGALPSMQRSFQACVRNLPAFIVMLVLLVIAVIAIYIAVWIVSAIVNMVAGQAAMQVVMQLLSTAVLMPVAMGTTYTAWKQMLGDGAQAAAPAPPVSGFEA
jgi:hypothetical protein